MEILVVILIILLCMPPKIPPEVFVNLLIDECGERFTEQELRDLRWILDNGHEKEYVKLVKPPPVVKDGNLYIQSVRNPTVFRRSKMLEALKIVK